MNFIIRFHWFNTPHTSPDIMFRHTYQSSKALFSAQLLTREMYLPFLQKKAIKGVIYLKHDFWTICKLCLPIHVEIWCSGFSCKRNDNSTTRLQFITVHKKAWRRIDIGLSGKWRKLTYDNYNECNLFLKNTFIVISLSSHTII